MGVTEKTFKVPVPDELCSDTEYGRLHGFRKIPYQTRRRILSYRFVCETQEQGTRYFYFAVAMEDKE